MTVLTLMSNALSMFKTVYLKIIIHENISQTKRVCG